MRLIHHSDTSSLLHSGSPNLDRCIYRSFCLDLIWRILSHTSALVLTPISAKAAIDIVVRLSMGSVISLTKLKKKHS